MIDPLGLGHNLYPLLTIIGIKVICLKIVSFRHLLLQVHTNISSFQSTFIATVEPNKYYTIYLGEQMQDVVTNLHLYSVA